jgi:hypothetical protein
MRTIVWFGRFSGCVRLLYQTNPPTSSPTQQNWMVNIRNYSAQIVVFFLIFFGGRIFVKKEGEVASGEVTSLVFRDSTVKTPKRGHEVKNSPLLYIKNK